MRLWPILLLARWAGLRRGEACALRWSEIYLAEGYLEVRGHEGGAQASPRARMVGPVDRDAASGHQVKLAAGR